jgi:ATP-dependent RNA helicase dbpA
MESFKRGEFRILVATDVASRGIDVEGITHVINLDIPVEKEAYVHRIGRTGRNKEKGKAISFVTFYEDKYLEEIESYTGFKIPEGNINSLNKIEGLSDEILKKAPKRKKDKALKINKEITKLYFNGGKKKKLRAVDFVGAISNIEGIVSEDIGIIEIQDLGSYVEILNGKGALALNALKNMTIKGKKLKVEKARK